MFVVVGENEITFGNDIHADGYNGFDNAGITLCKYYSHRLA